MGIINDTSTKETAVRPHVQGKFIFVGNEKLYIRGVSYGGFRPDANGIEYPSLDIIEHDFALMAAHGINAVRVYTTTPRSLLDLAQKHNLKVMVGLTAEQFVGYLIDKKNAPDIDKAVRTRVRACAGHPAVLCYVIGNEIPASIVRWLGPKRIERYLERLYHSIKDEDPGCLVTYVNYPTTEYLDLSFLDLLCFNVYLETQEQLESYLLRLQNIAHDRPLIMSEVGLDSLRNGEDRQATVLDWQIRTSFTAGCAGIFIFSWTDEWHRGGVDVDDWAFGLTTKERKPKPALTAVRDAYAKVPFSPNGSWPFVSVIVCTYNGANRIRNCCEGLSKLEYPSYEVIVVNDGSTDATRNILNEYDFRVINTENQGLSTARNTGMEAAKGEIIAYLDDDAYPDQHWLTYLASSFMNTHYSGIGGPNIAPQGDGLISECVSNAPGNPVYVLLSDQEAEHIPGCNMAFQKSDLQAIGGFDPQFRVAGDDVDVCWRLQQNGWSLGLNHAATVWHHRRNSLRSYWKQQVGYGQAEAKLMKKWPQKHNSLGHWLWRGHIYGQGITCALPIHRSKIYHGTWGSAPFQSLYNPGPGTLLSLSLTPEWNLVIMIALGLSFLGILWRPLLLFLVFLFPAIALSTTQAIQSARQAKFQTEPQSKFKLFKMRSLTAFLHLTQPIARLWGRLQSNLFPRQHKKMQITPCLMGTSNFWSEEWKSSQKRLEIIEKALSAENMIVSRGGEYDRWDLEIRSGFLGSIRTCMGVEDHGSGRQLIRFRTLPRIDSLSLALIFMFSTLTILATLDQAWLAASILGGAALILIVRMIWNCAITMSALRKAIQHSGVEGMV